MKRLAAAFFLIACAGSSNSDPGGPCAQRAGTYLVNFTERDGTCGRITEGLTTIDHQPTNADIAKEGCTGKISYSADNCQVTYDTTCPAKTIPGGRVLQSGKSTWDRAGYRGTAIEQHAIIDPSGQYSCRSTYDVVSTRQ